MTEQSPDTTPEPQTIRDILATHGVADTPDLAEALLAREDDLAEKLRLAGMQYGVYNEIVSYVLLQIGMGTPPDAVTAEFIERQYRALIAQLMLGQQRPGGDAA